MTRIEAKLAIEDIVRHFSIDDAKDWLAEAATVASGEYRRAGDDDSARSAMHVANAIAQVRNAGV